RAVGVIGAGRIWSIASAWVDGIAAGLAKNSPPMHDMIDRRVRAFPARLRPQSNRRARRSALLRSAKRCSLAAMLVADCIPVGWQRVKDNPVARLQRSGVVGRLLITS